MKRVINFYLEDYNAEAACPMSLVLFRYALEHISRINRIFQFPRGNALLVGLGGPRRKSFCTLATYMAGYKVFRIETNMSYSVTDWKEDMKRLFHAIGIDSEKTGFLCDDSQFVNEIIIEDINSILSCGDIVNLFEADEISQLSTILTSEAKLQGIDVSNNNDMYDFLIGRALDNLHVVLAMPPIGRRFKVDTLKNEYYATTDCVLTID